MRQELQQFLWIARDKSSLDWGITINGVDVSEDVLMAEFSYGLFGEDLYAKVELENSGEIYTGEFQFGHTSE